MFNVSFLCDDCRLLSFNLNLTAFLLHTDRTIICFHFFYNVCTLVNKSLACLSLYALTRSSIFLIIYENNHNMLVFRNLKVILDNMIFYF